MSGLSLIIFDWDGTLMDSSDKIVASMQRAAIDCEMQPLERHKIENVIGLNLPEAIRVLYPECELEYRQLLQQQYGHHFVNTFVESSPLFDGVPELLNGLLEHGMKLAIATGKSRRGLDRALSETNLRDFFVASRTADDGESKPHPGMILTILEELKINADAALMVGDTEYDLEMAARAGVASIGVTYGAHEHERLIRHRPIDCVDHASKLLERIRAFSNSLN